MTLHQELRAILDMHYILYSIQARLAVDGFISVAEYSAAYVDAQDCITKLRTDYPEFMENKDPAEPFALALTDPLYKKSGTPDRTGMRGREGPAQDPTRERRRNHDLGLTHPGIHDHRQLPPEHGADLRGKGGHETTGR